MKRITLLFVGAAIAFPATADAKVCPSNSAYELTKVRNVSCSKARTILHDYWKDQVVQEFPGWSCKQIQYPGGVTTKCRKGENKRIKHQSAD